jgi:hypothetical protein
MRSYKFHYGESSVNFGGILTLPLSSVANKRLHKDDNTGVQKFFYVVTFVRYLVKKYSSSL